MGCALSSDVDSLASNATRRGGLAVCSSVNSLDKGDIVLIVRSARVLDKGDNVTGSNSVYVQFSGKDGVSFEWVQASEVCAVLQGGGSGAADSG